MLCAMTVLSSLMGLIFLAFGLVFAVANRAAVTLSLWPFDAVMDVPLYLLVLGALLAGILLGGLATWAAMVPDQFIARRLRKDVSLLHAKLDQMQAQLRPDPVDPSLSLLPHLSSRWRFWGRR